MHKLDKWAALGERRRAAAPVVDHPIARSIESSGDADLDVSSVSSAPSIPSSSPIPTDVMAHVEDYLHGLSQIEFHLESNRDLPAWLFATQRDRDHIAVLEGLALLLVFAPTGDVAATSYWRTKTELKLLWAKNQPVDDSNQLRYIEDLLENVKNGTEDSELLKKVIPMCREKIFQRVKKLAKSFGISQSNQKQEKSNLWKFDKTKESHQKLEAALRKRGWFPDKSIVQGLDNFTRIVGRVTKASEMMDFWNILYFSWAVTTVAELKEVLEEKQVRYLTKLGDYVRILRCMPEILKKAGEAEITVEQVRPPEAKSIEVVSGSLDVLNLRIGQMVSDEITPIDDWNLVTDVNQKAQPGAPTVGKKTVTFTQHCEITLALEMLRHYIRPKYSRRKIEIGVSKACCEWCCQYLNLLASAYPKHSVFVRASHGKQPDGWMIPPDGSESIANQMAKVIVGKLDNIIWEIESHRRSDSNELPQLMEIDSDSEAREAREARDQRALQRNRHPLM